MYLIIDEFGSITKHRRITPLERTMSSEGYCEIIDITDPENPMLHMVEGWLEIEESPAEPQ